MQFSSDFFFVFPLNTALTGLKGHVLFSFIYCDKVSVILTDVNMKCGRILLEMGWGALIKFLIDKQHFLTSNHVVFCSL